MVESFSTMAFISLIRHEIDDRERHGHVRDHDQTYRDALSAVETSESAFPEGRAFFYVPTVDDIEAFFKNGPYEQEHYRVRTHENDSDERVFHIRYDE